MSVTRHSHAAEPSLAALNHSKQTALFYDQETLPTTVTSLIDADIRLTEIVQTYRQTGDELLQFNLALILVEKLRNERFEAAEKTAALLFFRSLLPMSNPWVKTQALVALGEAKDSAAKDTILHCMNDVSTTVVHQAYMTYYDIFGHLLELNHGQERTIAQFIELENEGQRNQIALTDLLRYRSRIAY